MEVKQEREREGERGACGVVGTAPRRGVVRQRPGHGARRRRGWGDADGVADRWAETR
jgi:hypothetical protein